MDTKEPEQTQEVEREDKQEELIVDVIELDNEAVLMQSKRYI